MTELYQETDDDVVMTLRRIHANGEQTHVSISSVGEKDYVAIAYDLRPSDYTPIASKLIGYDPTVDGVAERAERWMDNNPKGVAPGDDSSGGGMGDKIRRAAAKINDYGNKVTEQQQQNQQ